MPRSARLDIPGLLQHVVVRGIEKRDIFLDDADRGYFVKRLSQLLLKTETECLAWVLMTNHVHLLLRPKGMKLALLMRRLLTGYAVRFNLRYRRSGHLFQNRYKSIVCEEDPYLLELVRYLHLNPLRAGLVKRMEELDRYRWSGHAVLMGQRDLPGQNTEEVLSYFGRRVRTSRRHYREFVMEGISQGSREELMGGGLRRVRKLTGLEEIEEFDERILGSGEFVKRLRREKVLSDGISARMPIKDLVERVARVFGREVEDIKRRKPSRRVVDARSVISYFAVREMGRNGAELGRILNMSRSGVSIAADRGEALVRDNRLLRSIGEDKSTI